MQVLTKIKNPTINKTYGTNNCSCSIIYSFYYECPQGRRQGKSLWGGGGEGTLGVQGAEPLGGGQGAKPSEAEAFFSAKIVIEVLPEHVFPR